MCILWWHLAQPCNVSTNSHHAGTWHAQLANLFHEDQLEQMHGYGMVSSSCRRLPSHADSLKVPPDAFISEMLTLIASGLHKEICVPHLHLFNDMLAILQSNARIPLKSMLRHEAQWAMLPVNGGTWTSMTEKCSRPAPLPMCWARNGWNVQ